MEASVILTAPQAGKSLILRSMRVIDALSRPFTIELDLLSDTYELDFDQLLGQSFTIKVELPKDGVRYFNGLVSRFAFVGSSGNRAEFSATLRPWLWFLQRTSDCRIFQEMTVPDIVKDVFRARGFSDVQESLSASYVKRDYCVQYRESDFDFVSRLMEEEGIYYYFKHESAKHTLVLADSVSAHEKVKDYQTIRYYPTADLNSFEKEGISDWLEVREVQSGQYVLTDFNFETPSAKLEVVQALPASHAQAKFEVFDYPGEYAKPAEGKHYVRVRAEELKAQHQIYRGKGNARGLAVGALFKLGDHPRDKLNKDYLVTSARQDLNSTEYVHGRIKDQPSYRFITEFEAIDSKQQFRPQRITPRALVRGPQTAIVVGDKNNEIETDKYGRIKVRFHWDRREDEGNGAATWDKRSCWIRVSQGWAGKGWGQIHIPRVGQEVIVDFLEGDPDRPIVTGCVYNAEQIPPYTLPENKTQSGIKTRSTMKGTTETFNELRFEDKKGQEEIYFHAERDFHRVVENNDTLKVGFEKKEKGDQTIQIYNNQVLKVGTSDSPEGSQTITIYKNRTTTIEKGDETLKVYNNRTTIIEKGNETLTVKTGNRDIKVSAGNDTLKVTSGTHLTEAGQSITLKVGSNSIVIDQQGITIKGMKVLVQGDIKADLKSPLTTVSGDGIMTVKGGIVKIN